MPLSAQAAAYIRKLAALGLPPPHQFALAEARRISNGLLAERESLPGAIAGVVDREVPGPAGGLRLRLYLPEGARPFPGLLWFHGGGWVFGTLHTYESCCRDLANRSGCVVVSVDYRLAPEHKFPAAAEDCYAATCWVAANAASLGIDPERLAVAGDSAGGNLAAVACLMARDRRGPRLVHQLLVYPITDCSYATASYRENGAGYLLTTERMQYFWNSYLSSESDGSHPYASPLRAPDLRGLPPAFIITAEYDPLRDEGEAYAARLREAGVPATVSRWEGMVHGFFTMGAVLDETAQVRAQAAGALRAAFPREVSAAWTR